MNLMAIRSFKNLFKVILNRIFHRDGCIDIDSLRKLGVSIGEDVHLYGGSHIFIDKNFPWMLTIGNHVHITSGCHILCHDYSWIVGKNYYHNVLGGVGKVSIGNNVFIGTEAIILMNTEIGDNVIIGARSVVSGKIPNNCVVAGAPAKPIMSLDEYWNRREKKQYEEASTIVKEYYKRYGMIPPKEKLPAYFFLFENREKFDNEVFRTRMKYGGDYELCLDCFMNSKPMFDSYESFIENVMGV